MAHALLEPTAFLVGDTHDQALIMHFSCQIVLVCKPRFSTIPPKAMSTIGRPRPNQSKLGGLNAFSAKTTQQERPQGDAFGARCLLSEASREKVVVLLLLFLHFLPVLFLLLLHLYYQHD